MDGACTQRSGSYFRTLQVSARPGRQQNRRAKGAYNEVYDYDVRGPGATLERRTPEWITNMQAFMVKLDGEIKEAGEVVASHGLVDPDLAPL